MAVDGGVARHPVGAAFRLRTSRLLSPRTVTRANITLTTGAFTVFGGVRYDPVRRTLQLVPNPGEQRAGLEYVFTVRTGVLAWDGVPLAAPINVHVVPTLPAVGVAPVNVPSLRREVAPLFEARCAREGCHGGAHPTLGLDLSSPMAIRSTAVAVFARERPASARNAVDLTDPAWGAMYRVDPGDTPFQGRAEYSYLVYKLLGDGPIVGERMPRGEGPLSDDAIALVSDWIAAGAPDN